MTTESSPFETPVDGSEEGDDLYLPYQSTTLQKHLCRPTEAPYPS